MFLYEHKLPGENQFPKKLEIHQSNYVTDICNFLSRSQRVMPYISIDTVERVILQHSNADTDKLFAQNDSPLYVHSGSEAEDSDKQCHAVYHWGTCWDSKILEIFEYDSHEQCLSLNGACSKRKMRTFRRGDLFR